MSRTFSSLSIRNYRNFFIGNCASNLGLWMTRTAQAWLVLEVLTKGDATALGWLTTMMFLPTLLLTPLAGTLADKFPKRTIMLLAQGLLFVDIVILSALTLTHHVQLWHVFILALLDGVAGAFDGPSRQSIVTELVSVTEVSNAIGLNSTAWNSARLLGPGAAGVLIGLIGTGPVFIVNAFTYVAQVVALISLDRRSMVRPPVFKTEKAKFLPAVQYVRSRPLLLILFVIALAMGAFGFNQSVTNPLMTTDAFGKGATEFGLLGSIMGVGSLVAALLAARRPRPRIRHVVVGLGVFAVAMALSATAPTFLIFALLQIPMGLAGVQVMTTANAIVQMTVTPELRGRVMALWVAVVMGLTPIVSPVVGWVGSTYGARATVWFNAFWVVLAFVISSVYLYTRGGVEVHMSRRRPWLEVEPRTGDAS
ncbi:MAG: MFS transporter [Actinobacteria bacterium]|nr:MFS transporter [Actinomycetota bacterium]